MNCNSLLSIGSFNKITKKFAQLWNRGFTQGIRISKQAGFRESHWPIFKLLENERGHLVVEMLRRVSLSVKKQMALWYF